MKLTLKQARMITGFKQSEVAEHLDVHVQTYRKMEKHPDSVTIGEAKKICELFGMSYDYIFFNHDSTLGRSCDRVITT